MTMRQSMLRGHRSMLPPKSMISAAMPKTLVGISVAMLILAAVFGVLNNVRVKGLHADLANTIAARDAAQRGRMAQAKESKSQQTNVPGTSAKSAEAESKAAKAEADLAKVQKEKADLQARLRRTRRRSLRCKNTWRKWEANRLRQIPALHRQWNYRRSSMMLAVNSTARNARKSSCPKKFGRPRSVRLSSKRRRSGAPPGKQECAAPFSP